MRLLYLDYFCYYMQAYKFIHWYAKPRDSLTENEIGSMLKHMVKIYLVI